MIGQCSALDGYNEIIRLNKISSEEIVTIPNGKEIKLENMMEISLSFGQVCNFNIEQNLISFFFAGLTSKSLKKDEEINMVVNLIIGDDLVENIASCLAKQDVNPSHGKLTQADFECKIEEMEKASQCTGLEIVSSANISGIPSEEELINPALVDKLIKTGEIKDFTLEENKIKIESIPIFNTTSIDTSDAIKKGILIIVGKPLSDFELEEELQFTIKISGVDAECSLPKLSISETEIKIECILQEELKKSKIMIEQSTILDGYNEIISINNFISEKKVSISNGKQKKLENKFNSKLSFRQTNSFKIEGELVTFVIAAFTTESLTKGEEINVDINLLLNIDSIKEEAKCTVSNDVILEKDLQKAVTLNCEIKDLKLKENEKCLGLEILESESLVNIPKNPKLCNPKKSDKLISLGEMEQATETINIPQFNATSIDSVDSISSGIFTIIGTTLGEIEKDYTFNINLVTGETASCLLPKSVKDTEVKIECQLDGKIEKSQIMIPQTTVFDGFKEIFTLNKISTKKGVSCANGKLKKMQKKLKNKISFRQMSHFKAEDIITFVFSSFVSENMEKGKEISMEINVNKGEDGFFSDKATCILNDAISDASEEKQIAADFYCSVKDVENANKVIGLELISSDEISGIPSDSNMTNPAKIDELILSGEVLDYTTEENKKNLPPLFKALSLSSLGCRASGFFTIKGTFDKAVEHFRFNLPLSYPSVDTRCDVPKSGEREEVEVICKTKSPFSSSQIIIEQSIVRKHNSEVISILPISSEDEVSCQDFYDVYWKKMENLFVAPLLFRQVQKFNNNAGKISFSVFAHKTEYYNNENKITIKIALIKDSTLRHLDEIEIARLNNDCLADQTSNDPLEFKCILDGYDANGVLIIDSEDVIGIPQNSTLANPSKVDLLIKNSTLKNCSSEDCSLPIVDEGEINIDNCRTGSFNIKSNDIKGTIPDGAIFNLSILPESFADCQISNEAIDCYNKEEIEDDKILIPEVIVTNKNNYTDLFRLKGISSDTDGITCSINDNLHSIVESNITDIITSESSNEETQTQESEKSEINEDSDTTGEENSTISGYRFNRNKSDSGLTGGAIAAIVIACSVVAITIITLGILIKSGKICGSKNQVKPALENTMDQSNSIGRFKVPA